MKLHLPHLSGDEVAVRQAQNLIDRDERVLTKARAWFDTHRGAFIEQAPRDFGTKRASA